MDHRLGVNRLNHKFEALSSLQLWISTCEFVPYVAPPSLRGQQVKLPALLATQANIETVHGSAPWTEDRETADEALRARVGHLQVEYCDVICVFCMWKHCPVDTVRYVSRVPALPYIHHHTRISQPSLVYTARGCKPEGAFLAHAHQGPEQEANVDLKFSGFHSAMATWLWTLNSNFSTPLLTTFDCCVSWVNSLVSANFVKIRFEQNLGTVCLEFGADKIDIPKCLANQVLY